MVIWLIGLSGSGKTTLANEVLLGANKRLKNIVMLDGMTNIGLIWVMVNLL